MSRRDRSVSTARLGRAGAGADAATPRRFAVLSVMSAIAIASTASAAPVHSRAADPRLREVTYDPHAVVTVPVQRGVVTLVVFDADEAITDVAAGLGGDCTKAESAWCVSAQAGGRTLFIKPKSSAGAPNNLAVVTDRRTHSLRFDVLADGDTQPPVYRLIVRAPPRPAPRPRLAEPELAQLSQLPEPSELPARLDLPDIPILSGLPALPAAADPQQLVSERLQSKAVVRNAEYSMAVAPDSQDIAPTLAFDDGRFTYFRVPGNRDIPAVFQVLGDGSETLVNSRMEGELLVLDRVSRRWMLRAGSAVVGVWNEAFDRDGRPPEDGTTVPGVQRVLKADHPALAVPGAAGSPGIAGARP